MTGVKPASNELFGVGASIHTSRGQYSSQTGR